MMQKEQESAYSVQALLLKNRCLTDKTVSHEEGYHLRSHRGRYRDPHCMGQLRAHEVTPSPCPSPPSVVQVPKSPALGREIG